ncbi:large ribosomal subunit protein eL20z [Physcomitrium patens]|uniref:60S ribosomal protein L18a-like protein n=1 Tax=Physcomitrium patens TaxID=3218 RepID=A9TX22_PHYPA|nr:60S ribosomal protein L18a-like protein [Physcomitrium patens]PNR43989.1 hypothetical protein PHYPA_016372 [Physcomitrium patens]|eukprot:XP_024391155.1 60S ribosomal protein L18a-like protein [Physcomitrella patens]
MTQQGNEGYYGTFQNQHGMPQPVPPSQAPYYNQGGYNPSVPGYPVDSSVENNPHRRTYDSDELPFCGLGFGWFLFILGFFIVSVPWYVGAFIFFCLSYDYREKTGLTACVVAALVFMIFGGSQMANHSFF